MDKKSILTVAGFVAALAAGGYAAMAYVHSAQERDRDILQRVMSEQFATFDTDGDKFLSKAELEVFARNSYQSMVRGDNSPAQQDRTEFTTLYKQNAQDSQSPSTLERHAQEMFDYADMNDDDILTEDEYVAFYMKGLTKMNWPDFNGKGIALLTGPRAPAGQ